jgi:hypothetical protein
MTSFSVLGRWGEGTDPLNNQLADYDTNETLSKLAWLRELASGLLTVYSDKSHAAPTVRLPTDVVGRIKQPRGSA